MKNHNAIARMSLLIYVVPLGWKETLIFYYVVVFFFKLNTQNFLGLLLFKFGVIRQVPTRRDCG